MALLEHGGRLIAAARRYGIPLANWLDLSTGINSAPWTVPPIPASLWSRLPEAEDELHNIAAAYYGTPQLLALAGSQAAILSLPQLLAVPHRVLRVGVFTPSYAEHAKAWQKAGHQIVYCMSKQEITQALAMLDVLILVNPNNPTGERFTRTELLAWHTILAARAGYLIVDEAFADADACDSVCPYAHAHGLIVLRSLGKFFGLAGARVGFVAAAPELLHALNTHLGPWTLSGPARYIAALALSDSAWHQATRQSLAQRSQNLAQQLHNVGLTPSGATALFQWVKTPHAQQVHENLARRGILTRYFAAPASLRFGLPATEEESARLQNSLKESLCCA